MKGSATWSTFPSPEFFKDKRRGNPFMKTSWTTFLASSVRGEREGWGWGKWEQQRKRWAEWSDERRGEGRDDWSDRWQKILFGIERVHCYSNECSWVVEKDQRKIKKSNQMGFLFGFLTEAEWERERRRERGYQGVATHSSKRILVMDLPNL
jgi:hypothetical protein